MDESQFGACRKKRFVAAGNHDLTQRSVGQVFCLVDDENVRRFPLASVREQVHGERRSAALCKRMGLYRQRVRRAIGKDPGSACHTRRALVAEGGAPEIESRYVSEHDAHGASVTRGYTR